MSNTPRLEDDPTPIKDRAAEIIGEFDNTCDPLDAKCSGWPCVEVQTLAYRLAVAEDTCETLKQSQCRCNTPEEDSIDGICSRE